MLLTDIVSQYPDAFTEDAKLRCGDGWGIIIEAAVLTLSKRGVKLLACLNISGALQLITTTQDEYVASVVNAASKLSLQTCEQCGDRGSMQIVCGDLSVSCPHCLEG